MEMISPNGNPLKGLISNEVYEKLSARNLLHDKAVRDYTLRRRFRQMREADIPAAEAIERLREEHAYLQFDTIRKIVYRVSG